MYFDLTKWCNIWKKGVELEIVYIQSLQQKFRSAMRTLIRLFTFMNSSNGLWLSWDMYLDARVVFVICHKVYNEKLEVQWGHKNFYLNKLLQWALIIIGIFLKCCMTVTTFYRFMSFFGTTKISQSHSNLSSFIRMLIISILLHRGSQ